MNNVKLIYTGHAYQRLFENYCISQKLKLGFINRTCTEIDY